MIGTQRTRALSIAIISIAPLFAIGSIVRYWDDPIRFPLLALGGAGQIVAFLGYLFFSQRLHPMLALACVAVHAIFVAVALCASVLFLGGTFATLWMIWLLADLLPLWALTVALVFQALTIYAAFLLTPFYEHTDPLISAIVTASIFALGMGCASWFRGEARLATENRQMVEQLSAAQDEARELSRLAGEVSERERLALDIHDTIAQDLTSIVMQAQSASLKPPGANLERELSLILEMAREGLTEARALVADSAASDLGPGQFVESMALLTTRFNRETSIVVSTVGIESFPPVSRNVEVVLIRSIQECLANVRKHAAATQVLIRFTTNDNTLDVLVSDNGAGYDIEVAEKKAGFGIQGIRKRIHGLGGKVRFVSEVGMGSQTMISIPRYASEPDEHDAFDFTDY